MGLSVSKVPVFMRMLFAAFTLILFACSDANNIIPPPVFTAQIGMQATHYAEVNQLEYSGHVDKQPAGLNFYEQSWSVKSPATVNVAHGEYSFEIPHVLSMMGVEDTLDVEAGLYSIYINASLSAADTIMHNDARLRMGQLFTHLLDKGWQPFVEYFNPRLVGADSYRYALVNEHYHPSPAHMPSLETWMALNKQQTWAFYADDVMLHIHYFRDGRRLAVNQPGDYLLHYALLSKTAFLKQHFEQKDFANWPALWPAELARLQQIRAGKEAELMIKNYIIDDQYVDPWVKP